MCSLFYLQNEHPDSPPNFCKRPIGLKLRPSFCKAVRAINYI